MNARNVTSCSALSRVIAVSSAPMAAFRAHPSKFLAKEAAAAMINTVPRDQQHELY
jgi:hypothetical protein